MASENETPATPQSPISNDQSPAKSENENPAAPQPPISNHQSPTESENETPATEQSPISNHQSPMKRRSTGPRTRAGKRRSSRNARKHGLYSHAQFFWDAAIELGEDPRQFQELLDGLIAARLPADTLEMVLVEQIALLVWKQMRLERSESAVQMCNLQKHDLERRKLYIQVGRKISDVPQSEIREKGLRTTLDAPGKFELVLTMLDCLAELAETNEFSLRTGDFIRALYGEKPTLRGSGLLKAYTRLERLPPDSQEFEQSKLLFRAGVAEETSDVLAEYEQFLHEHVENSRAARVAATAPTQAQWAAMIRQENALHRQLERKIRLLEEIQEKRKQREEARRADLLSKFVNGLHSSGGSGGGVEEPQPPDEGDCGAPPGGEEPGTPNEGDCATSVSAGLQQSAQPKAADLEKPVCGTRCHHFGVRQRSLRSCRLDARQPMAQAGCRERTGRQGCEGTDRASQFCATPSCGEEPQTPKAVCPSNAESKKDTKSWERTQRYSENKRLSLFRRSKQTHFSAPRTPQNTQKPETGRWKLENGKWKLENGN